MDIILPFTDCIFSILLSFALKLFNIGIDITYLFDMVLSGYLKLRIIAKLTTTMIIVQDILLLSEQLNFFFFPM